MAQNSRKVRGRRTEIIVAEYMAERWENARPVNSGASGSDILGTPYFIEVKARALFSPLDWVKSVKKREKARLGFVIYRANGQGDTLEAVDDYLFICRLGDIMPLLEERIPSEAIIRCKGCGSWTTEGRTCEVCEVIKSNK